MEEDCQLCAPGRSSTGGGGGRWWGGGRKPLGSRLGIPLSESRRLEEKNILIFRKPNHDSSNVQSERQSIHSPSSTGTTTVQRIQQSVRNEVPVHTLHSWGWVTTGRDSRVRTSSAPEEDPTCASTCRPFTTGSAWEILCLEIFGPKNWTKLRGYVQKHTWRWCIR